MCVLGGAGPFFSRNKKLPPLHEKLMAALGMRGLATNGLLAKVTEQFPEDRGIARLALWTVEHQFLQVGQGLVMVGSHDSPTADPSQVLSSCSGTPLQLQGTGSVQHATLGMWRPELMVAVAAGCSWQCVKHVGPAQAV